MENPWFEKRQTPGFFFLSSVIFGVKPIKLNFKQKPACLLPLKLCRQLVRDTAKTMKTKHMILLAIKQVYKHSRQLLYL
ncbi:hypothetical protein BV913_03570 [Neisseria dumasiana]|uniref:Transposase n=1 Tax=Neisseria dumasiana TaxID=1931275 RepID=A0ABX3WPE6_9NEIS|nr:hypothetical protein BV913_03570 [Neisseria dumasiana]